MLAALLAGAHQSAVAQESGKGKPLPEQLYGRVRVIDGKSLAFTEQKETVRLAGYEAPEIEQTATSDGIEWPVGQVSRSWLILRTLRRDVNCAPLIRAGNDVIIAHCFVGDVNLAASAISDGIGYAYNYPNEPQVPAYFDLERKARGLGFGVWSAQGLLPPWRYRYEKANPVHSLGDVGITLAPLPLPPVLRSVAGQEKTLRQEDIR
ncbi:nuclease [Phyllobacterium sophorae]|uniref:Nuclease n=1 Tax=Phyllobacterium sophorae TaxID=1520277 RepID=A0A2P7B384_9HYPH|nr:nuclease [Phyllobacterium sophorae]PSH60900.1 nuclease [Phyllobacterium sophorae]